MYFSSTVEEEEKKKKKVRTGIMPEARRAPGRREIVTGGNENVAGGTIKPEGELKRELEQDKKEGRIKKGGVARRSEEKQGMNPTENAAHTYWAYGKEPCYFETTNMFGLLRFW